MMSSALLGYLKADQVVDFQRQLKEISNEYIGIFDTLSPSGMCDTKLANLCINHEDMQ